MKTTPHKSETDFSVQLMGSSSLGAEAFLLEKASLVWGDQTASNVTRDMRRLGISAG